MKTVAVRMPGIKERVWVADGTRWIPVTQEIVSALGGHWSDPVIFRLQERDDGLIDIMFQAVEPPDEDPKA